VQEARGDRFSHRGQAFAVGLAEALPVRLVLGQEAAHDLVGALAQRGYRRHHLQRGEPALEAVKLGLDDPLGSHRLGLAAARVALDDLLHVVDVVEADAGDLTAGGLDVAWHGDVDQQQRAAAADRHHLRDVVALDDVVRRVGRRDDDVGRLELLRQLLEADRVAAEALGEADRAVVAAVGDEDG
jgi:hypothetical protein